GSEKQTGSHPDSPAAGVTNARSGGFYQRATPLLPGPHPAPPDRPATGIGQAFAYPWQPRYRNHRPQQIVDAATAPFHCSVPETAHFPGGEADSYASAP